MLNYYNFGGISSPCKNCEKRHIGCHSKCNLYIDYKKELAKIKKEEMIEKINTSAEISINEQKRKKIMGRRK